MEFLRTLYGESYLPRGWVFLSVEEE
jgi:hypothetical protein